MINTEILVGLTKNDAIAMINADEQRYRIRKEDGESFMVTMDWDPVRINLEIENGIVTQARLG
jgi:hypothetical protein